MSNNVITCLECDYEISCEFINDIDGKHLDVPEHCPNCSCEMARTDDLFIDANKYPTPEFDLL